MRTAALFALLALRPAACAVAQGQPTIDESHPDYYARRYWRNYRNYWGFKYQNTWQDPELRDRPLPYDEEEITERLLRGEDAREVFKDVPGTRKPGGIRPGRGPLRSGEAPEPASGPARVSAVQLKNESDARVEFALDGAARALEPGEAGLLHAERSVELRLRGEGRGWRLEPGQAYAIVAEGGRIELRSRGRSAEAAGSGRPEPRLAAHPYAEYRDAAIVKVAAPEGAIVIFDYPDGESRTDLPRGTGAFRAIVERPRPGAGAVTFSVRVEAELRGLPRVQRTQFVTVPAGQQVEVEVKPNAGGNGLRVLWW